eukprot:TRINITY_DN2631_c3_g1_i1.p1 TRINITY_DN2631_c3_g1~~TRINITY_DN2631_c3_g1_i1.p1  ORF type:complete len:403 (+),score=102.28 TRINITY_DN2631_c3_g1_i1:65-1210(+)
MRIGARAAAAARREAARGGLPRGLLPFGVRPCGVAAVAVRLCSSQAAGSSSSSSDHTGGSGGATEGKHFGSIRDFLRDEGDLIYATRHTLQHDSSGALVTLIPGGILAPPSYWSRVRELLQGDGFDLVFLGEYEYGSTQEMPAKPTVETDADVSMSGNCVMPTWEFHDNPRVQVLHPSKSIVAVLRAFYAGWPEAISAAQQASEVVRDEVSTGAGKHVALLYDAWLLPILGNHLLNNGFTRLSRSDMLFAGPSAEASKALQRVIAATRNVVRRGGPYGPPGQTAHTAEQRKQAAFVTVMLFFVIPLLFYQVYLQWQQLGQQSQLPYAQPTQWPTYYQQQQYYPQGYAPGPSGPAQLQGYTMQPPPYPHTFQQSPPTPAAGK